MFVQYRFDHARFATIAGLMIALALSATASQAPAATVISIAPGSEGPAIAGMIIEDFEDVTLVPGLTVEFSVWRNGLNLITANPPVAYTGTLPATWAPSSNSFPLNAWDGTRALVNGWNHDWAFPFASSVELRFSPPVASVGIGLGNFQSDVTLHSLFVNGVDQGTLESLSWWVSIVNGKNGYVLVLGEPISSLRFTNDTHFDGLAFDKLAIGEPATPAAGTSWGRVKSLYH